MIASPKVLIVTLNICPRVIWVDVDRKRFVGRKELKHPPSSSTRGSRRTKIWKDLYE